MVQLASSGSSVDQNSTDCPAAEFSPPKTRIPGEVILIRNKNCCHHIRGSSHFDCEILRYKLEKGLQPIVYHLVSLGWVFAVAVIVVDAAVEVYVVAVVFVVVAVVGSVVVTAHWSKEGASLGPPTD